MADFWKKIGVEATYEYRTPEQLQDRQDRVTFTGITMINNNMDLVSVVRRIAISNLPTAENRWTGTNRGGYVNPAWDQIGGQVWRFVLVKERGDLGPVGQEEHAQPL